MADKREAISEQSPARHQCCCHHWIIEAGTGATSMGVCKLCGKHKEFSNNFRACSVESRKSEKAGLVKQGISEPSARRRNQEELGQAIAAVTHGEMLDQWLDTASRIVLKNAKALGWRTRDPLKSRRRKCTAREVHEKALVTDSGASRV